MLGTKYLYLYTLQYPAWIRIGKMGVTFILNTTMKLKFTQLLPLLFLLCHTPGFTEGTKEIMPVNTGIEKIRSAPASGETFGFAYYGCDSLHSLNIHIAQDGEVIYYGFNKVSTQTKQYRILDPAGTVVFTGNIPTTGNGYIDSYDKAVAGPSQIVGAAGYTALLYTPLMTGDYTMEFQNSGGNYTTLLWFDITVASPANVPVKGRVWSRAWQFDTGTNTGASNGTFYIYTDDGLVTSMYLNGLQGIVFTVACNQVGCPDPSGVGYTRKSVDNQHVLPRYKIFLNDPDPAVYPTGTLGVLSNVLVTWNCNGTADITFDVTQAGTIDVLLDINPLPGQQSEDVLLSQAVLAGPNLIHWNGLNGLLQQVPNGTTFNIIVTYIMGLTNFPVYDVEQNKNGLIINLIRPTGSTLSVYWDDTDLTRYIDNFGGGCTASQFPPPTTSNYTGCNATVGGCHTWLSIGCSDDPCQCSYGNRNTMNQWWYAVFYTAPEVNFVEHRIPGAPASLAGPLQVCAGVSGNTYTIDADPNSTTYTWEYTGTGATFNPPNPTGTTATIDFAANATSGLVRVRGWNQNCLDGPWSSTPVTIKPIPQVTNTASDGICSDQTFQMLLTSNPPTFDFTWTVTCNPLPIFVLCPPGQSHLSAINDYISITGINPGTVTYEITPVLNGCTGAAHILVLDVSPLPNLVTTVQQPICSGEQTNIGLSSGIPGTGFDWIVQPLPPGVTISSASGSGDLIQETITNTNVFPVTVNFDITPSISGCTALATTYPVVVNPTPHLSNAAPGPICSESTFNAGLTMDVTNPQNPYFTWTASCSPPGSVTGFPTTPVTGNTIGDVLTNTTTDPATVTYHIIPFANGCQGVTADYSVTVNPTPHLSNMPHLPICSGDAFNVNLTMDVNNPVNPYFEWTASCTPPGTAGGFPSTLVTGSVIADILTNSSDDNSTVTYSITPYANSCQGTTSGYNVIIRPVATVNAVTPQIICSGQTTQAVALSSNVTSVPVDYSWTVTCDPTGIPTCPSAGSGNPIPAVAISNTDLDPRYANYTITPSVAGCSGTPFSTYNVQVNPSPTITNSPLFQEICSGSQSALVVLTANVSGTTTFDWTVTPSSGAVTGFVPGPGTGDIPVQTINNSSHTTQGYVDFHIIPSSQSGMPCPGAPADYRIWVNPLPDPSISGPLQVCYDQSGTAYSTASHANHDYLWTVTGANSWSGDHTSSIMVDWGPGPAGTVQVTEVDQNFSTNCSTTAPVRNIIINPAPNPGFVQGTAAVCQGTAGVVYATQPSMSNYIWTVSPGGTITAGGTTLSPSLTVTWHTAGPQTVSVNYTNANGCAAVNPTVYNVMVNTLPNSTISEGSGPACSSQSHQYQAPPDPACSFTWSVLPPSSGTVTSGQQGTNMMTINWLTSGPATVAVTATNNTTGCLTNSTYPVTVNPSPVPAFSACFDVKTTTTARKFTLRGGMPDLPLQGVYSGSRVSYNPITGFYEFNPSGAGPGNYPVTYTYTNVYGCSASTLPVIISVLPSAFNCNGDLTDVRDGNKYKTALINGKCWMTENLRYGLKMDQPLQPQTENCISEKYCLTTDDAGCTAYGGLYQWDELIQYGQTLPPYQGVCPPGWHVPTSAEWQGLIDAVTTINPADGIAGTYLKDLNPVAGFHALLKGIYYLNYSWAFATVPATMFWTSTLNNNKPVARGLNKFNPSVSVYESSRANAFPVRCVQD